MKLITRILLTSTFLIAANTCFADDGFIVTSGNNVYFTNPIPETNPGKGFYIGGNMGGGISKCNNCSQTTDSSLNTISTSSTSNNDSVADLFGGYQFSPYFAVELGFTSLPSVKVTWNVPDPVYPITDSYIRTAYANDIYLALKGILPVTQKFSLFGKLGLASELVSYDDYYTGNDINTTATGTYLALGASYYFSPHWAGLVSLNRVATSNGDTQFDSNYLSFGFHYLIF